jgi:hypothetical protein
MMDSDGHVQVENRFWVIRLSCTNFMYWDENNQGTVGLIFRGISKVSVLFVAHFFEVNSIVSSRFPVLWGGACQKPSDHH